MNIEQERAELLPCPFCGGSVSFHQDDEECRDGCHYIECKTCGTFDLSTAADPTNTVEALGELRFRIAHLWNRRAALQSQATEAFPCRIVEADFETGTVTLEMQGKYAVSSGQKYLCDAPLQSQDREDEPCKWHNYPETDNVWDTDCGQSFEIYEGTPTENKMGFCCYCGKPIREAIDHAHCVEGDGE